MRESYHTALSGGAYDDDRPLAYWQDARGNVAKQWDIFDGVPNEALTCDVIYADLPWHAGYSEFNRRAGASTAQSYAAFLAAADALALERAVAGVAVFWIMGNRDALAHMHPQSRIQVSLNKAKATAAVYGEPRILPFPGEDTSAFLARLALAYERVFDPCAGFGRAGRIFAQAGKRYTLTDHNGACIRRISEDAPSWIGGGQ